MKMIKNENENEKKNKNKNKTESTVIQAKFYNIV